jgi:integrase
MSKQGMNPYKRPDSPYWYIWWLDASGRERRKSTRSKHLPNARRVLAQVREEAENARTGLVDRFAKSRRRPVEEFVRDYRAYLDAHDRDARYVSGCVRHLHEAIGASEPSTLAEFDAGAVALHLTDVRARGSWKTYKEHVGSLKAFGTWLLIHRLWPENPFESLKAKKSKDGDKTFVRMGLEIDQVTQLAESATVRGVQEWARTHAGRRSPRHADIVQAGEDRALLYWAAATTGFRKEELGAWTWEDLTLDGDSLRVELSGRFTKNGKDAKIPLQQFIADALKDKRQRLSVAGGKLVSQRANVFHVPVDLAEHVRRDAVHAGILKDHRPAYKRLDFHSLRYSCVRILRELKVPVEMVQKVLRHSDIRLTLELYGSTEDEMFTDKMRGVVPVPDLFARLGSSVGSYSRPNAGEDDETRGTGPNDKNGGATSASAG